VDCRSTGETNSDIIAAVLQVKPDWSALPQSTPAGVTRLLKRCLEKEPKRRLRDAGDLGAGLEEHLRTGPIARVLVGAIRISGPHALADGDQVRLGSIVLTFRVDSSPRSTETLGEQPA